MQPVFALISFEHVLLFALIFLVLFGGKKIRKSAKGLGEGIRNFKAGLEGRRRKEDEASK